MINGFRIENLRSIVDSGKIEIKRINVLVGKNSSGKSTVLRFLPLLRQSIEQATKGAILWYGRLVDFGSFRNAARDNDVARGIKFSFNVIVQRRPTLRRAVGANSRLGDFFYGSKGGLSVDVSITLGRSPDDQVGNIRQAILVIEDDVIEIKFDENGFNPHVTVMGRPVTLGVGKAWWMEPGSLFSQVALLQKETISDDEPGRSREYWGFVDKPFFAEIVSALGRMAHGKTSNDRLVSIANRLIYANSSDFHAYITRLPGVSDDFRGRLRQIGAGSSEMENLRRYVLLTKLNDLTTAIGQDLSSFARSIKYIEPLRATAERYYRQQDLAVEDIDSRGANTAMFLSSLSADEMADLQQWMMDQLGFQVVIESDTGHAQIKIVDEKHVARNIADLGFGYSQVLPIAIQIWRSSRSQAWHAPSETVLAMEQPELHLHPDYQARLADVIASSSRVGGDSADRFRVFVETHSDHFINRLGALVDEGRLEPSEVQILVVKEDESGASVISAVGFDDNGLLGNNWPVGFFTPEVA